MDRVLRAAAWRHKILLFTVVATVALRGFSTTMVEVMILPLAVLFMTRWLYVRRLPLMQLATIAVLFMFLAPVKKDIRESIGQDLQTAQASATTRALDWIEQASRHWVETLAGRRDLSESASYAAERTDMIHSFAHTYSLTPSVLPYQYGVHLFIPCDHLDPKSDLARKAACQRSQQLLRRSLRDLYRRRHQDFFVWSQPDC